FHGDSSFSALVNSDSKTSIKKTSSFFPQSTLPTQFEKEPYFIDTQGRSSYTPTPQRHLLSEKGKYLERYQ
ncbi:MAG: hypothetical protein KKC25_07040, partial [Proteobacteria bacterium]|nr:hypothetical protein [Pseudomonadota bacterium]